MVYQAKGQVRAGVDLAKAEIGGGRILLPGATVQDVKVVLSESEVLSSDRGFLGLGPDTKDRSLRLEKGYVFFQIG